MNSIPDCFVNKILPLWRDVISVRKSPMREFLMAAFQTITNSVATVLNYFPLTYVHYVSMEYFSVSLVGILRWSTTVTAKGNRSQQKANSLTAKANIFTQRSTAI